MIGAPCYWSLPLYLRWAKVKKCCYLYFDIIFSLSYCCVGQVHNRAMVEFSNNGSTDRRYWIHLLWIIWSRPTDCILGPRVSISDEILLSCCQHSSRVLDSIRGDFVPTASSSKEFGILENQKLPQEQESRIVTENTCHFEFISHRVVTTTPRHRCNLLRAGSASVWTPWLARTPGQRKKNASSSGCGKRSIPNLRGPLLCNRPFFFLLSFRLSWLKVIPWNN